MIRPVNLSCLAAAFALVALATACNDPQSQATPTPRASLLPWGGTMAVGNTTTGSALDPDGYEVWVDDAWSQAPPDNGASYFYGLTQGDHKVSLIMVAANCVVTATVNGGTAVDNPRNVSIGAAGMATTNFDVGCASVGSLVVGTNTTGVDLDADGYTVSVDGSNQPVATNGSVTFTGLATGSHSVGCERELHGKRSQSADGDGAGGRSGHDDVHGDVRRAAASGGERPRPARVGFRHAREQRADLRLRRPGRRHRAAHRYRLGRHPPIGPARVDDDGSGGRPRDVVHGVPQRRTEQVPGSDPRGGVRRRGPGRRG